MSANLMTWWWLQSVGDGCKVWRWQIVVLAIVKIKNLNKPNVPMPAHTYSNLQFVSFWFTFTPQNHIPLGFADWQWSGTHLHID